MYQYVEFDGVPLPLQDHQQQHDPTPAESTIIDSIGGTFDWLGSTRRVGRRQVIALTGKFTGETVYVTDEAGVILTDESGEYFTFGTPQGYVRGQVVALLEKIGVRGSLWRERMEDGVRQWKTARLLAVPWARKRDDVGLIAELSAQFETQMAAWRAETATNSSTAVASDAATAITLDNGGGLTVDDGVITVARTSGTITQVDIDGTSIDLQWTGSLAAGDVLTIDCGARTVIKNAADAYDGFVLQAGHSAQGWLPLHAGQTALLVTLTGGGADVNFDYYEQFA